MRHKVKTKRAKVVIAVCQLENYCEILLKSTDQHAKANRGSKFDAKVYSIFENSERPMKVLLIPAIMSTLLMTASGVDAAACESGDCASEIRHYGGLGMKATDGVFQNTTKGWFKRDWNKVMAKAVKDYSCAFEEHHPIIAGKFRWSEAYVDSSIKPTRAQASDPNWSNYVWNNQTTDRKGYLYDGITDALNDSLIDNGKGIAKLAVRIGLTATNDNLIPPVWMRKDKSLAWEEGTNQNSKSDNWHVRFDNPKAVDHAADFLAAFLAKFGNNKGIHSINLGEYWLGQQEYRPSDVNQQQYLVGVKNLWRKIIDAAPLDENGQRVNIVQTNPLFGDDVSIDDMEAIGMGVSRSDARISFPIASNSQAVAMKQLYDGQKVHVMIDGDARYACQGRRQSWDGTANPFGHKKGYSGVATPQEVFWYHSEEGPAPTHSFTLTIANWCSGAPQTTANFIDAIKKFGRCGTQSSKWGASPAAVPARNNVDSFALKPSPPPAVEVN